MGFKETVHDDIKAVFLNLEEFADYHNINGNDVPVIFDDIENVERSKLMQSHMDGLYTRQKFLYIAEDDFNGPLPGQGVSVRIDGKVYIVVDATEESGVFAITLEAARARGR